jgi:hypothetical protein
MHGMPLQQSAVVLQSWPYDAHPPSGRGGGAPSGEIPPASGTGGPESPGGGPPSGDGGPPHGSHVPFRQLNPGQQSALFVQVPHDGTHTNG